MVVERGHRVAGKKPGAASRGRRDSFVAGTDVHHPADRSLPMDAARCMVRDVSRACGGLGPPGWRRQEPSYIQMIGCLGIRGISSVNTAIGRNSLDGI